MENKKDKRKLINKLVKSFLYVMILFVCILIPLSVTYILPMRPPIYESKCTSQIGGFDGPSAMWEYDIQPEKKWFWDKPKESWAFLNMEMRDIKDSFDLSECEGISFWIKGDVNTNVEFSLFTHAFYEETHVVYEYWDKEKILVNELWRKKTIYFSDLTPRPWAKEYFNASDEPDLKKVYGIGFTVRTKESRIKNTIFIDEVELIYKNGSRITISDFTTFNTNIKGKEGYWHCWWGHQ